MSRKLTIFNFKRQAYEYFDPDDFIYSDPLKISGKYNNNKAVISHFRKGTFPCNAFAITEFKNGDMYPLYSPYDVSFQHTGNDDIDVKHVLFPLTVKDFNTRLL